VFASGKSGIKEKREWLQLILAQDTIHNGPWHVEEYLMEVRRDPILEGACQKLGIDPVTGEIGML